MLASSYRQPTSWDTRNKGAAALIIAAMPPDAALAARITWATMSKALRTDPLFVALIAAGHATANQVNELFAQAARI